MSDNKFPYIPKEYYPAVMYACSCIRKYGTFNVACNSAAKKYQLDVEEIKKYVRERQGAGQKGQTRKYKFYAVWGYSDYWVNDYDVTILFSQIDPEKWGQEKQLMTKVIKATSYENAKKQIPKGEIDRDLNFTGYHLTDYQIREFETEDEAKTFLLKNFKVF